MHNVSLYELMAEEMEIKITKNPNLGFNLQITNSEDTLIVDEHEVHPCAMASFADFCAQFLYHYRQSMIKELEKNI